MMGVSAKIKINVQRKITITSESLYIVAYCMYVVSSILSTTQFKYFGLGALIITLLKYIAVFVAAASVAMKRSLSKNWICVVGLMTALCAAVMVTNERLSQTVILFLFILCGGVIMTSDRVFRAYLKVACITVIFTLLLYAAGIYEYDVYSSGGRTRLYLGFTYTTYLANYFFHFLLVYYSLKKKEIGVVDTCLVLAMNQVIYILTDTNAVYYEVYLFLIFLWILKLWKRPFKTKIFSLGAIVAMPIMCILAFFMSVRYDASKPIWVALNSLLTHRLSLAHNAIEEYGLSLFGSDIVWVTGRYGIERTEDYFYVDSSYINIALTFGVIVLILVLIGFCVLSHRAAKEQKYVLCISLILLAVHSFSDPQLLDLKYDPFLLLLVWCFIRKNDPIPLPQQDNIEENKRKLQIILKRNT
ncbi:MAG: hypothetical protein LUH55_06280 [Bacteroides thetaiotaomicron]|nr:hypothetical protein [Bacteroides thetaiotaomicron]MCD7835381.1 hypothetical protein [Lachnospiraceae bacterium]